MKYLSAQPDVDYFIWQLEVQCYNFRKFGIEKDMFILLGYNPEKGINPNAKRFVEKTNARVFFYPDDRVDMSYPASIKPHLVKKFFKDCKIAEPIFYHDSDIIFREKLNLDFFCDENKIYLSDTVSYIGAKYIISKSEKLLKEMCKIVGIDDTIVRVNQNNSGGAQYCFSGLVDYAFWDKIEMDSIMLYKHMIKTSKKYSPNHPIQAWCAEMWATLWNMWLFGHETTIVDELRFCLPTDLIENVKLAKIMHNAGVQEKDKNLFFKGDYINNSPYGVDFSYVDKNYCSYLYVDEINKRCIYDKEN